MKERTSAAGPSVMLAFLMVFAMGGAWYWRRSVFSAPPKRAQTEEEKWDHVKQDYPISEEPLHVPELSQDLLESIVHANPFSPMRHYVPPPDPGESGQNGGAVISKPPAPIFTFKGRINLGSRQRAIVEDTMTKKTYFLEVGQEVAGFKVLDITENRVVLSDPNTNKEVEISLTSKSGP